MTDSTVSKNQAETTSFTCAACGQVFITLDNSYLGEYPNSSDKAVADAELHHRAHECPVAWKQNWSNWREAAGAYKFEKPWQLIDRRMSEGWTFDQLFNIPCPPDRQYQDDWQDEIEANIITNLAEQKLAKWKKALGTIPEGVSVCYGIGVTDAEGKLWKPSFEAVHYRRAAALGIKI